MKASLWLPILLLAGACAETASFQPTENVTAAGHGGQPAAGYDVGTSASGGAYVHVNVWSEGAREAHGQTQLAFGVEVRDLGHLPVQLDQRALELTAYDEHGQLLPVAQLVWFQPQRGSMVVAPGTADTYKVVFQLPGRYAPDHLGTLRLRWGLVRQDGQPYVQFSAFNRTPEYYGAVGYYYPGWGYYDPFFTDPFFWGWGPPYYYVPARPVIVEREHVEHHHGG